MRLGKYSGKIYAENEVKNMQECGACVYPMNKQVIKTGLMSGIYRI